MTRYAIAALILVTVALWTLLAAASLGLIGS